MREPINFLGVRRLCLVGSIVLIVAGIGAMVARGGPNLGIDFQGGVHIVAQFSEAVTPSGVLPTLSAIDVPRPKIVVAPGNELLIDTVVHEAGIGQKIVRALRENHPVSDISITEVGANVGNDLKRAGIIMVILSLGLLLLYISLRFEWRFAVGAIAAVVHDVLITVGLFAAFGLEINLPTLAAFLAVVGYSVNDTIVVFDRIRENQRVMRGMRLESLMNSSITQVMARTILTSVTTLVVVVLLFVESGPGELRTFSLALIFGIIVGTYSSIYIASALVLMMRPRVTVTE